MACESRNLYWQQVAAHGKARRAREREYGTAALRAAGIEFAVLDGGWHLRITRREKIIDFTPSTGCWSIKGQRSKSHGLYRGVRSLIRYLAVGELPYK